MTPTTALGVVSHVGRRDMAFALVDQVRPAALFEDSTGIGCEANHARAWQWMTDHRTSVDWCVVLEDDAQPVEGFHDQLAAALAVAPAPIVSLYLGTGYPPLWQPRIRAAIHATEGTSTNWLLAHSLLHAVGVAIRSDLLPMKLNPHIAIDQAISNWAKRNDHLVAYTLPSLVDHADEQPVITQRFDRHPRTKPRRAHIVGTRPHWTSAGAAL